jgi:hypothetical protein
LKNALADPDCVIEEAPFTVEIVDAMRQVPRADVPDMPDRIVAATGVYLGVPVISCDGRIAVPTSTRSGDFGQANSCGIHGAASHALPASDAPLC